MGVQESLQCVDIHPFSYIPNNGIVASCSGSTFTFLSFLQTDFHSGWTNLHFYQQCMLVPSSLPQAPQCFLDEMESQCGFHLHFLYG
jgi:hypothetical protein